MPGIRKSLIFRKKSKFCKEIYKNDHIIYFHVNTEVLTIGLVIPSGMTHSPAVASTQGWKYKNDHIIDILHYWAGDTLGDEMSTISGIDPVV